MPRTKRPVSRKENLEVDETTKKLERILADQKNKIDMRVKMAISDIELAFKILLGSISSNVLEKTVGELRKELLLNEAPTTSSSRSSQATSHDDGYLTGNTSHGSGERRLKTKGPPSTAGRSTGRRSRSADATARKPPSTINRTVQRRRSKSVYRTPAYNKNALSNYPVITPKVAPHTSLTVLRQPRQGEMVLSMSGSPVMVPTYNNMNMEQKANCNIMLEDGTMLSLQPKQLRQSQVYIPFALMDDRVLHQMQILKDNLETVVNLGKNALVNKK